MKPGAYILAVLVVTTMAFGQVSDTPPAVSDNTTFPVSLARKISTAKLSVGDEIGFRSESAMLVAKTVVPAGALFHGRVTYVQMFDNEPGKESRLAILVHEVTWKKVSLPLRAWLVGWGSRRLKLNNTNNSDRMGGVTASTAETFNNSSPALNSSGAVRPPTEFAAASAPNSTRIDYSPYTQGVRIFRYTDRAKGVMFVRAEKNIEFPADMPLLLQQISAD